MNRGVRVGFDDRRQHRILGWTIAVVLAAGLLSFIAKGADGPADPFLKAEATATTVAPAIAPVVVRTPVAGFGEVSIRLASGPQLCALLAQTEGQQARGLMERTDLAGHVGMLFVFPAVVPPAQTFFMLHTPMPLSIAWFDAAGRFVSATDMVPCAAVPCPTYAAAKAYRYALEVPRGQLGGIGAGPGSVLTVGGACA